MPIRFTAFVPTPSRTCRISRCYRSTTTRSKRSPRAPSLHCELYRPCESNTVTNRHTSCCTCSDTCCYHKTWVNKGDVYSKVCVITQEWNQEVEKGGCLPSSQTHGCTYLLWPHLNKFKKAVQTSVFRRPQFCLNECLLFDYPGKEKNHTQHRAMWHLPCQKHTAFQRFSSLVMEDTCWKWWNIRITHTYIEFPPLGDE